MCLQETIVYACNKKSKGVFVCFLCVCQDNVCDYVRAVPSVDGLPETQCESCV